VPVQSGIKLEWHQACDHSCFAGSKSATLFSTSDDNKGDDNGLSLPCERFQITGPGLFVYATHLATLTDRGGHPVGKLSMEYPAWKLYKKSVAMRVCQDKPQRFQ